ncbi:MAG: hypothetical protein N2691_03700 [Patescibacteria group bacterium]|nr:hypothetical protein [Patescibacteria group bacterium]
MSFLCSCLISFSKNNRVNLKIIGGNARTLDAHIVLFQVDGHQFYYTYGAIGFEEKHGLTPREQWLRKHDGPVFVTEEMNFMPTNPPHHGYFQWRMYCEQLVRLPDTKAGRDGEIVIQTDHNVETIVFDTKPLNRGEFGSMLTIVENNLVNAFTRARLLR